VGKALQAQLASREQQVRLGLWVRQGRLATKVRKALQAPRGPPDQQVQLERWVRKDRQA
jgi:hypothetical protein